MTTRTSSLVLLFATAAFVTGPLLALTVWMLEGRTTSVWIAPLTAAVCHIALLLLGRRFILPPALATSLTRSALALTVMVPVTMATAFFSVWGLARSIGIEGGVGWLPPLVAWFFALWLAIAAVQRLGVSGAGSVS